jgi:hypothetical protein
MAFRYIVNKRVEVYESNFHFWYVNGFYPDPKQKEEIVEEKLADETTLRYSQRTGEGGRRQHSRSSWRR